MKSIDQIAIEFDKAACEYREAILMHKDCKAPECEEIVTEKRAKFISMHIEYQKAFGFGANDPDVKNAIRIFNDRLDLHDDLLDNLSDWIDKVERKVNSIVEFAHNLDAAIAKTLSSIRSKLENAANALRI